MIVVLLFAANHPSCEMLLDSLDCDCDRPPREHFHWGQSDRLSSPREVMLDQSSGRFAVVSSLDLRDLPQLRIGKFQRPRELGPQPP